MLTMLAEARLQETRIRERELTQRMHWYDVRAVDRLERALGRARARLRMTTPATLRAGSERIAGGAR